MNKSENINELVTALSRFQGEVRDAEKDCKAYSYKYAQLDQIFDIIRPLLSKHGLSFSQPPHINSGTNLEVETWIFHSSGQYINSSLTMPINFEAKGTNSLQKIGMAISYAKRYAIMGILGLCQKDDDDDGACDIKDKPTFKQRAPEKTEIDKISTEEAMVLAELLAQCKKTDESLCTFFQVSKITDLNKQQFGAAKSMLEKAIQKAQKPAKAEEVQNDNP